LAVGVHRIDHVLTDEPIVTHHRRTIVLSEAADRHNPTEGSPSL